MPEAKVYQCDKTEGLRGERRKCGREVTPDGVYVVLEVGSTAQASETKPEPEQQVKKFCGRAHAQYWLIRQRLA